MEFPQGEGREWWEIMNINTPVTDKRKCFEIYGYASDVLKQTGKRFVHG